MDTAPGSPCLLRQWVEMGLGSLSCLRLEVKEVTAEPVHSAGSHSQQPRLRPGNLTGQGEVRLWSWVESKFV